MDIDRVQLDALSRDYPPFNLSLLSVEESYEWRPAVGWMSAHWTQSMVYSAVYVLLVLLGRRWMAKRPDPFDLRAPMAAWSACLAVFSIMGFVRTATHIYLVLRYRDGLESILCDPGVYEDSVPGFWSYAFALSKLYELGDTAFIVLRRQPLTFLHVYHHVTVFIYCWHGYGVRSPTGLAFGSMNYFVHSMMYTYYLLKALRFRIPRPVAMIVTTLQLLQMVGGLWITCTVLYFRRTEGYDVCPESFVTISAAFTMYASYFILFLNFFTKTYLKRKNNEKVVDNVQKTDGCHQNISNGVSSHQRLSAQTIHGDKVSCLVKRSLVSPK